MQLNQDQREGVAKVSDNLATACVVAAIVGGFIDHKIGWPTILALFGTFAMLVFFGIVLRQEGEQDGH